MDLRLATLKAVSFYLLHSVSALNQCRKFSCVLVVCKHFANYEGYPKYFNDVVITVYTTCTNTGVYYCTFLRCYMFRHVHRPSSGFLNQGGKGGYTYYFTFCYTI